MLGNMFFCDFFGAGILRECLEHIYIYMYRYVYMFFGIGILEVTCLSLGIGIVGILGNGLCFLGTLLPKNSNT